MPGNIHHYTDAELKRYRRFWAFIYHRRMPYWNDAEVLYLLDHYKCPPWRWPVPTWYKGKLNAMRAEVGRTFRETGRRITMEEAQKIAERKIEDEYKRSKKMQKVAVGPDDSVVWSYKLLKKERRKKVVRV